MQRLAPTGAAVWLIVSIPWILHGIAYADMLVLSQWAPGERAGWPAALAQAFIESVACWIVLTVFLVETVRRVPLTGPRRWHGIALLAGAAVAVLLARAAYLRAIYPQLAHLTGNLAPAPPFADFIAHAFRMHAVRVIAIIAVCYAWFHRQATRANHLRIAELEAGLVRARADAASARLNPGFLFNALDTIAARMRVDGNSADRLLVALSTLLRRSLSDPAHEIAVLEEVALTKQLFALERTRLGEHLQLSLSVAPECEQALVPSLLLPPIVEIALARGPVGVAIRSDGDTLVIDIDGAMHDGELDGVATRLHGMYGERAALTRRPGLARVELPLRRAEPAQESTVAMA